MTLDQQLALIAAYEARFGAVPEELRPANWSCEPGTFDAMEHSLKSGIAMTIADLTQRMGPPDYEEMIGWRDDIPSP